MIERMLNRVEGLGEQTLTSLASMGRSGVFLTQIVFRRFNLRQFFPLLIEQLYFIGILSLLVIIVSGLFIGMVVALQGFNTLQQFAAEQELGQLLALSVTRELGPVVSALLFAGRAGTAVTAEIGLMQSTEQIAGMEMMAVDPLSRIIAPRLWAGLIALPILTVIFSAVSIGGGYFVGVEWLGVDGGSFWANMQSSVDFHHDVLNGVIKSVVFGFVCIWIAVYQGFHTFPSAEGVGRSTTKTVVYSSLVILGLDFVLTAMMMGGWS